MKAFVTGGTGFIGSRVIRRLRERGDEVVALVRSPEKATELRDLGCELVEGDLSSEQAIRDGVRGCDAVFHIAAVYKVGIPASEREAMRDANVGGTERVLDAADRGRRAAHRLRVDRRRSSGTRTARSSTRPTAATAEDFLSCYEETKWQSHQVALDRIAKGAPIVIVQPGGVYGPGDHSELGNIIDQASTGKLQMMMFPETGFNLVHVDDVADGIVLAYDKGQTGESYVLGGQIAKMRELVEKVSEIAGRKAPKRELPVGVMKLVIPIGPLVGKAMGFPPNLRELIAPRTGRRTGRRTTRRAASSATRRATWTPACARRSRSS